MAYTTVNKSRDYFKTKLYTGNGSAGHSITGIGFEPDLVWIKRRSGVENHVWNDVVRGVPNNIYSSSTNAQDSGSLMSAILSDGFTVQTDASVNSNNDTYASFNWKAGGAGSANTDGDVTSTVSVNTTAGFSIVKWNSTGTAGINIGHGLGKKPALIIAKCLNHSTTSWPIYHQSLGATKYQTLNTTNTETTSATRWNNSEPTTTTFQTGSSGDIGGSDRTMIAYCFADIQGYSKTGLYQGGDKTFVYTGFKPRFILGKENSSSSNYNWHLFVPEILGRHEPSSTVAEYTDYLRVVDWNSNGFRWGTSLNNWDRDDRNYVYIAFGQTMVGTNNVPCTAGSTDG